MMEDEIIFKIVYFSGVFISLIIVGLMSDNLEEENEYNQKGFGILEDILLCFLWPFFLIAGVLGGMLLCFIYPPIYLGQLIKQRLLERKEK